LNEKKGLVHLIGSRNLWAPFLFMVVSLVMTFVVFIFYVYNFIDQYVLGLPDPSQDVASFFSTAYALIIPLFLIGISLFLLMLMKTKGNVAYRSKLIFLSGAIFIFVGSLINVTLINVFIRSHKWIDNVDLVNQLSYLEGFLTQLGLIFCIISTLFLIGSFLKGEVFIVQMHQSSTESLPEIMS